MTGSWLAFGLLLPAGVGIYCWSLHEPNTDRSLFYYLLGVALVCAAAGVIVVSYQ